MKLSKEKYAVQRKRIKVWLDNKPDANLLDEVSSIGLSTYTPLIIVVEYIMEIKGRKKELVEFQQRLMNFYHVDEII